MKLIVTGASGALGSATASLLERKGHDVARIVRNDSNETNPNTFICSDLINRDAAETAIGHAAERLGGLDGILHFAGTFAWRPVVESDGELWHSMLGVNLETTLNVVQAALNYLEANGAIVTVGAAASMPSGPGMAPYAASKSAVSRLTESLATELGRGGIRINTLLPAIIDTPNNRAAMKEADPSTWTHPEAIAETAAFLVSPAARAIHGASIPVTNAARW